MPSIITKNNTYCKSTTTNALDTGITNHKPNIKNNESNGAAMKIKTLEFEVYINSVNSNLTPSAIGCKLPHIPILLGPRLLCILAMVLRSNRVISAIANSNGTICIKNKSGTCT